MTETVAPARALGVAVCGIPGGASGRPAEKLPSIQMEATATALDLRRRGF